MTFNTGDLVRGTRPWNKSAHYGVILKTKEVEEKSTGILVNSLRVFWISPGQDVKQFTTWEVESSVWKWQAQ